MFLTLVRTFPKLTSILLKLLFFQLTVLLKLAILLLFDNFHRDISVRFNSPVGQPVYEGCLHHALNSDSGYPTAKNWHITFPFYCSGATQSTENCQLQCGLVRDLSADIEWHASSRSTPWSTYWFLSDWFSFTISSEIWSHFLLVMWPPCLLAYTKLLS